MPGLAKAKAWVGGAGADDLSEEARRIASGALTAEELAKVTEEYEEAEEARSQGIKESRRPEDQYPKGRGEKEDRATAPEGVDRALKGGRLRGE